MPGGDPRTASIVRINAGARTGSAVYVRPDLVLTTAALVAGSAVVEIATADGTRVLGLVARTDQARNLALVQVARPGPPVAVYDGPAGRGRRFGRGDRTDRGRRRPGDARPIPRRRAVPGPTGATSVDLAKVDARAPPVQPDGLPWFLGDRVIAVGTGGPRRAGPELALGRTGERNSRLPLRR